MPSLRVSEILTKSAEFLSRCSFISNSRYEAELLLSYVLNCKRIDLYLKHDTPLSEAELAKMRELIIRRKKGEPVAYLVQRKGFFKSDFYINSSTLIPRPETELLVEKAIELINQEKLKKIVDFGTGSGAIGLSIKKEQNEVSILLVDKSEDSIQVAKKNAQDLNLIENVEFLVTELSESSKLPGQYDMIVGNPPYIDYSDLEVDPYVKKYEPEMALFAKDKGLSILKGWVGLAQKVLVPKGWCLLEHGYQQGERVKEFFLNCEFENINSIYDLAGHWRHTYGQKKGD